jgi:hypothetical protein
VAQKWRRSCQRVPTPARALTFCQLQPCVCFNSGCPRGEWKTNGSSGRRGTSSRARAGGRIGMVRSLPFFGLPRLPSCLRERHTVNLVAVDVVPLDPE